MTENNIKKILVNDHKLLLNKTYFLWLLNLFKKIFIKRKPSSLANKIEKKLKLFHDKINNEIIKIKEKFINMTYSKENMNNIIDFVKKQNLKHAGDILEDVLIYTFSFAFYSDKENTFGKYIFSNMYKFKDPSNFEITNFFSEEKFEPVELHDIKNLLSIEEKTKEKEASVIYNLLLKIFKEKYAYLNNSKIINKSNNYLIRGLSDNQKLCEEINNYFQDNSKTILEKDYEANSIMSICLGIDCDRIPIRLFNSLLIQVFIYSQNKNSPLMNYLEKNGNLEAIEYVYDLRGASIEGRFTCIIISPLRLEPRIRRIELSQNNLRENGFSEIAKLFLANKNIKDLELDASLFRGNFIEFFNITLGLFDNYSVEKLNLSFNYFKDNCEEFLSKLITHFKGLKTLNLTANEFKRGLCSLIIVLKKLYRQGKTKLEKLMINKSLLDEAFYYEMGELLKCKYCKLKYLDLNFNSMPSNINFLKKLKKNKTIVKISLNKNDITNLNSNDIMKVMSYTELRSLYLFKNRITNFNIFLRILYRTKLIKDEDNIDPIIGDQSFLANLDLSNNDIQIKNINHIALLNKIVKQTNLYCLDISHILYGLNPQKYQNASSSLNIDYKNKVENLKKELEKDKTNYIEVIKEIRKNKVDISKLKELEDLKIFKSISDEKINEIISHSKAKLPVFLRKEARKIITDINNEDMKEIIYEDDILNREKFEKLEDNLVNYFILKRSKKDLEIFAKKRVDKKLIII